jgi:hypothetical protein
VAAAGAPSQVAEELARLAAHEELRGIFWLVIANKQARLGWGGSFLMSEPCPGERSYVGLARAAAAGGGFIQ